MSRSCICACNTCKIKFTLLTAHSVHGSESHQTSDAICVINTVDNGAVRVHAEHHRVESVGKSHEIKKTTPFNYQTLLPLLQFLHLMVFISSILCRRKPRKQLFFSTPHDELCVSGTDIWGKGLEINIYKHPMCIWSYHTCVVNTRWPKWSRRPKFTIFSNFDVKNSIKSSWIDDIFEKFSSEDSK